MNSNRQFILNFLLKNKGQYVTSSFICERLGLTRAGVSKHIKGLIDDGYYIECKTRVGYKLIDNNILSKDSILHYIDNNFSSITVDFFNSVDSTNNVAKRKNFFSNEKYYLAVSREQTDGKGRMGRSFFSPKDKGIYMSLAIKLNMHIDKITKLTTATSVFVVKALKEVVGIDTQIKWINDIYYDDKKVCGILTESINDVETGIIDTIIVGIGINLYPCNNDILPVDIKNMVGTILKGNNECLDFDRNELVANIINQILSNIYSINDFGLRDIYKKHSLILNENIVYTINGEERLGIAIDIDENGGLLIKNDCGEIITLSSGEISVRKAE